LCGEEKKFKNGEGKARKPTTEKTTQRDEKSGVLTCHQQKGWGKLNAEAEEEVK